MLNGDASVYLTTHFRNKQNALLKQREIDRQRVSQGIADFDSAAKRAGYIEMFQPDCDYMVGLARAHAEAVQKGYELEGQLLTPQILEKEIMPEVAKILSGSSAAVICQSPTA